jgi:UDP-N-acetyl-2-amino-2-deoxyglucuronate dehydrogenase
VATNIGIHFFDLLLWLFGAVSDCRVHYADAKRMAGYLELKHARVKWFLSVDVADLPFAASAGGISTHRSITIDGEEIEFTQGFTDLHTRVYQETLAGNGFGIADARPSIALVQRIRATRVSRPDDTAHPWLVWKLAVGASPPPLHPTSIPPSAAPAGRSPPSVTEISTRESNAPHTPSD